MGSRTGGFGRHRELLGAVVGAVALSVTLASAAATTGASASVLPRSGNANFIGVWVSSPGGWTILTQDAGGACTGTSVFGYAMSGCQVTGNVYVFTLTTGSYTSNNSGTIAGNSLTGSFSDSNGTMEDYTATRSPLTTAMKTACTERASPAGTFSCDTSVTASAGTFGAPTGDVELSATFGGLSAPSCALAASSATASTCTVAVTPTSVGNEHQELVRASYAGDGPFASSTGESAIDAVMVTARSKSVDTYLEGSDESVFEVALSRASDITVVVHYATRDGSGRGAATASDGDYQRTEGALTIPAGARTASIEVRCFADVTVRSSADFELELSQLTSAAFGPTFAAAAGFIRPDAPITAAVREDIDPNLRVGQVGAVRDLTTGGPGKLYVRRYGSTAISALKEGDAVFVGDELFTNPNSAAAVEFALGGAAAVQPGGHVHVVDERHTYTEATGRFIYLRQLIKLIGNVSHQKETIQIQTNGGIIGIKD